MTTLIIDIGSSSVRTILYDEAAKPRGNAQLPHTFNVNGHAATADPLALAALVETALDMALARADSSPIKAVGMATFVGNVVGLDQHSQPVTPLYTYADGQAAEDAQYLASQVDATASHQRTGCRLHSAYLPARLHWLRRTQPEQWKHVYQWVDLATFLYQRWFGHAHVSCSYSVASWSGLLNRHTLAWDTLWLDLLGLNADQLPPLAEYNSPLVGLSKPFDARWPALAEATFYLAVGDGAAANIGSGAISEGDLALTVGTSAAVRQLRLGMPATIAPALWCYRLSAQYSLYGGATSEGGNLMAWAQQMFNGLPQGQALEAALAARPPDRHGLTVVPTFWGERSPAWRPNALGAFYGLHGGHTALEITQALMESLALRLARIVEAMGPLRGQVYAGGGALARSAVWAQMIADALNHPLQMVAIDEVTARGLLLLIGQADRPSLSLDDLPPPPISTVIRPRPDAVALLQTAKHRQIALEERLFKGGEFQSG
jgi:gluconokinase